MAGSGGTVEEVVDLSGMPLGAATELMVGLAQRLGYTVAPTGLGVYRLARTRKKLLGRIEEALTVRVYETRSGPGIRLIGDPAEELVAHLREAGMHALAAPAPTAESSRVVAARQARPDPPQVSPLAPAVVSAAAPPTSRGWVVDLPDGRHVPVAAALLIGRDPDLRHGPLGAMRLSLADVTVSKTHLLIEPKGGELAVTDLHSTNGTTVDSGVGVSMCPAGAPVRLQQAAVLSAGDARLVVRPVV